MNSAILYQWQEEIASHMGVNKAQAKGLALFSIGVMMAETCIQSKVAEHLWFAGKADTVERRLQRLLANRRLNMKQCGQDWIGWVLQSFLSDELVILVDETKLGAHLSVMMVGIAYRQRCIPLIWRCYQADAYPPEGQVKLITRLLQQVAAYVPAGVVPLVEVDRGLGTSPDLVTQIQQLGWHYLFRVQNNVRFRDATQHEVALSETVQPGHSWSATGQVFKKFGWLTSSVHVIWEQGHEEPWCLITNAPHLSGWNYAYRNWQEQSFRDLKSGGWQWHRSQVWKPDHADRLLLVLALAYALTLTSGLLISHAEPAIQRRVRRGSRKRFSLFRLGLRYFKDLFFRLQRQVCLKLLFVPDKPLLLKLS